MKINMRRRIEKNYAPFVIERNILFIDCVVMHLSLVTGAVRKIKRFCLASRAFRKI